MQYGPSYICSNSPISKAKQLFRKLYSLPYCNIFFLNNIFCAILVTLILKTMLLPNWALLPILTLLPNSGGFHRTLQRVRLATRGRLLLRTPGPVPFGTCICSNVETILSWTCHVYGPFEFRPSLGTYILLRMRIISVYWKFHTREFRVAAKSWGRSADRIHTFSRGLH